MTFTRIPHAFPVITASGDELKIVGIGDVRLEASIGGWTITRTLHQVLHVPAL